MSHEKKGAGGEESAPRRKTKPKKVPTLGATTAPEKLRERVKSAIDAHGVTKVHQALGISSETLCRLAGGIPIRAGTVALATANLSKLDALAGKERTAA